MRVDVTGLAEEVQEECLRMQYCDACRAIGKMDDGLSELHAPTMSDEHWGQVAAIITAVRSGHLARQHPVYAEHLRGVVRQRQAELLAELQSVRRMDDGFRESL